MSGNVSFTFRSSLFLHNIIYQLMSGNVSFTFRSSLFLHNIIYQLMSGNISFTFRSSLFLHSSSIQFLKMLLICCFNCDLQCLSMLLGVIGRILYFLFNKILILIRLQPLLIYHTLVPWFSEFFYF